jgi:hypothetical protein
MELVMNIPELALKVARYVRKDYRALGCASMEMFRAIAETRLLCLCNDIAILLCNREEWSIINKGKVWLSCHIAAECYKKACETREPSLESWTAAIQIYGYTVSGERRVLPDRYKNIRCAKWVPVPIDVLGGILRSNLRLAVWRLTFAFPQQYSEKKIVRDVLRSPGDNSETMDLICRYMRVPLDVYVAAGWQWRFTPYCLNHCVPYNPELLLDPTLIERLRTDPILASIIKHNVPISSNIICEWERMGVIYN